MTPLSKRTLEWILKVKVLLQLFNKSKLKNGTKTLLEPKFLFIVKFKKLGFGAPLSKIVFQKQKRQKFWPNLIKKRSSPQIST